MKRTKLIAVFLAFALVLTACGGSHFGETTPEPVKNNLSTDCNFEAGFEGGQWQGEGDCYKLETYNTPIDAETQAVIDSLGFQEEIFCVLTWQFNPDGYWLQHNGETIYVSQNIYYAAALMDENIWILENRVLDGKSNYQLLLISSDGSIQKTIALADVHKGETYGRTLVCASGKLYVISDRKDLVVIDLEGSLICTIPLSDETAYLVSGADSKAYLVQPAKDNNQLYLVDTTSSSLTKAILCENGSIFNGEGDHFLLLKNSDGLYAVTPEGHSTPIVLWSECGISINSLFGIYSMSGNQFLLMTETGPKILSPASPDEMKEKTTLKIAAVEPSNALKKLAADFSNHSDYNLQILDYSDGGAFDAEQALTRFNTDILSGNYPDMICFSHITPYPYVSKKLLADLGSLFKQDDEIKTDDISIINALSADEGIYYISGAFDFETLVAKYSDFGDRYGWTLAEYLNLEKAVPDEIETIHNMTKESFINCVVSRYIRTAVDWDTCECNFNTPEFIELLKAGSRIRETPENAADMSYGYGPAKVGEGTRIASLSWVDTVWKLAYEEQMAGCKLSFIGWPTVDGSCGSDLHLIDPIGIVNSGEHALGCWEFVKFMLLHPDMEADHLPVYMPLLREKLASTQESGETPVQLSDDNADRFLSLLSEIENVAIYDNAVLDIISKESAAFFEGDKTAEDAAELIQSKVSIYLAEQR